MAVEPPWKGWRHPGARGQPLLDLARLACGGAYPVGPGDIRYCVTVTKQAPVGWTGWW